jgi:hypothetical protein
MNLTLKFSGGLSSISFSFPTKFDFKKSLLRIKTILYTYLSGTSAFFYGASIRGGQKLSHARLLSERALSSVSYSPPQIDLILPETMRTILIIQVRHTTFI